MATVYQAASARRHDTHVHERYTTYQEPDTQVPPKARPVLNEISVNGVAVPEQEIMAEAQHHPAENPGAALTAAARALVVRELLKQEATRLGLAAGEASCRERHAAEDETLIGALIEREIDAPRATEEECLRFYRNNPDRFRSEDIYEARHILIAAHPDDAGARSRARHEAERLIGRLKEKPDEFAWLARSVSDCPSKEQDGNLGQVTRGSTVAEFEDALTGLSEGELCMQPVESRYGFHVVALDRRVPGETLPFELARPRIAAWLEAATWSKAVAQYVAILAARAEIRGIEINAAEGPLIQ